MDEVKAMARAGENVGKAVGTGIRSARHGATRAGRTGVKMSKKAAARAEKELAARGYTVDDLQELVAQRATGKSRKQLAKQTKKTQKRLGKNAKVARKELARLIEPEPAKSRRKWPWVLLALAGLAAAGAVLLSRRPEELPIAEAEYPTHQDSSSGRNGSSPSGDGQVSGSTAPLGSDAER